ncbi:MAG: alpha-glucosidase [Bacillales bacterium]|jgi:oligo-1,6-glucosidase|nr:alpha-glucosidase [Bacillales bacterium]
MSNKYFENNVVYQIYPRSFKDSNGDGFGDLQGIINKLDYLKDLGVGILWLSPIYKSPDFDNGYDISDYYQIDSKYGTMEDLKLLIQEGKKRNIRIVMDLVVNHTSTEHEWFLKALKGEKEYQDFYYFRKGLNKKPPNNWQGCFTGSAWKYKEEVDLWYLHLFAEEQADLNWHNPEVMKEVKKILNYYLEMGVYGFRCDVINYIYKNSLKDGKKSLYLTGKEHYQNTQGMHDILKELRRDVFDKYDCLVVGETGMITLPTGQAFLDKELDMFFQFEVSSLDFGILPVFHKKIKPQKLINTLIKWQNGITYNTLFFENHDGHRCLNKYVDGLNYHYHGATMLATILMTLKGTPFIYQGQEIGMMDLGVLKEEEINDVAAKYVEKIIKKIPLLNIKKIRRKLVDNMNRDHSRTPMQWTSDTNAGFSKGKPWFKVNPNYLNINVEKEENDNSSVLAFYKQIIQFRKENTCLSLGDIKFDTSHKNIFKYFRTYNDKALEIIINVSSKNIKYKHATKCLLSNYKLLNENILQPYEILIKTI